MHEWWCGGRLTLIQLLSINLTGLIAIVGLEDVQPLIRIFKQLAK